MKRLLMGGAAIAVVAATLMAGPPRTPAHIGGAGGAGAPASPLESSAARSSVERSPRRGGPTRRRPAGPTIRPMPGGGSPNCYWARVPVHDAYGNPISWRGRPRLICPPY